MQYSVTDKISSKIAPIIRKLSDINIKKLLGTETQLLRIVTSEPNVMGEYDEQLEATIIENVLIKRPYASRVQMLQSLSEQNTTTVDGIDLWELLPIEVRVVFKGDYNVEPVSLKKNDILVEILQDENNNPVPFIMEVTKVHGAFHNRYIVGKYYECCLYRGQISPEIQEKINEYLSNFTGQYNGDENI